MEPELPKLPPLELPSTATLFCRGERDGWRAAGIGEVLRRGERDGWRAGPAEVLWLILLGG